MLYIFQWFFVVVIRKRYFFEIELKVNCYLLQINCCVCESCLDYHTVTHSTSYDTESQKALAHRVKYSQVKANFCFLFRSPFRIVVAVLFFLVRHIHKYTQLLAKRKNVIEFSASSCRSVLWILQFISKQNTFRLPLCCFPLFSICSLAKSTSTYRRIEKLTFFFIYAIPSQPSIVKVNRFDILKRCKSWCLLRLLIHRI